LWWLQAKGKTATVRVTRYFQKDLGQAPHHWCFQPEWLRAFIGKRSLSVRVYFFIKIKNRVVRVPATCFQNYIGYRVNIKNVYMTQRVSGGISRAYLGQIGHIQGKKDPSIP